MPIQALSKSDLANLPRSDGHPEYVEFIKSTRVGNGGKCVVAEEGAGRQTVKKRLKQAAQIAGKEIKFHRSPQELVVFEVVS